MPKRKMTVEEKARLSQAMKKAWRNKKSKEKAKTEAKKPKTKKVRGKGRGLEVASIKDLALLVGVELTVESLTKVSRLGLDLEELEKRRAEAETAPDREALAEIYFELGSLNHCLAALKGALEALKEALAPLK